MVCRIFSPKDGDPNQRIAENLLASKAICTKCPEFIGIDVDPVTVKVVGVRCRLAGDLRTGGFPFSCFSRRGIPEERHFPVCWPEASLQRRLDARARVEGRDVSEQPSFDKATALEHWIRTAFAEFLARNLASEEA